MFIPSVMAYVTATSTTFPVSFLQSSSCTADPVHRSPFQIHHGKNSDVVGFDGIEKGYGKRRRSRHRMFPTMAVFYTKNDRPSILPLTALPAPWDPLT
jgi:hypothetical protein